MNDIYQLIEQIPIRHNLVSSFVLVGNVLLFLIVAVIFIRTKKSDYAIRVLGWLLLLVGLIGLDNYSCYTGLMKYMLHLNDSTELFILLLGPFIYFLVRAILQKKPLQCKWDIVHFILPISYVIFQLGFFLSPIANKYNAYINAYHPDLLWYDMTYSKFFLFGDSIKSEFRLIVLASFIGYVLLSIKVYFSSTQEKITDSNTNRKKISKSVLLLSLLTIITILFVFLNFSNDLGDHFISIFFTIGTILLAGFIMAESRFFEKSWIADKYETSGLKSIPDGMFRKIDKYVVENQYYLKSESSLTDLSIQLSIPSNYISQAINKNQGTNFNDYINLFRITEAKKRLTAEDYKHYKIESIGQSVGFNAKSTFYAAFKKHAGVTPSAYLKSL